MKALKQNMNSIVLCIFELVVGILLLVNPIGFTSGIVVACGIAVAFVGVMCIVRYFRMEAYEASVNQLLLKGLIALSIAAFCIFRSQWLVGTFSLLTMIYGVVILVTGLSKVQWTVDMIRFKRAMWFMPAISAVVSILCGMVILMNPFKTAKILWMFIGISLIVEAVFDIISLFIGGKNSKED